MKRVLTIALVLILVLTVGVGVGCIKNQTTPHPNQVSALDGQAYDRLVEAQAALDEAKVQYVQGNLPTSAKQVINAAGSSYDITRNMWLEYRGVVLAGKDATAQQAALNNSLPQLIAAINNLKALLGGKH